MWIELDKYLTNEPEDDFSNWSEVAINKISDKFYYENEDWILLWDGLCNNWLNKLYDNNKENDDYNAFIVLYIFRLMLLPPSTDNQKYDLNINNIRGLLYTFFIKGLGCAYFKKGKVLFTFSHGGIPNKIVSSDFDISKYYDTIMSIPLIRLLKNFNLTTEELNQTGGNVDNITSKINVFNDFIATKIKTVLGQQKVNQKEPTNEMLFMLMMSSPFNCNGFITNINKIDNHDLIRFRNQKQLFCGDFLNSKEISPFSAPGFDEMKKLTFSIENETVVQVFGHNPIGYGISFDYVEKNSILINLDTTNSFASDLPGNTATTLESVLVVI